MSARALAVALAAAVVTLTSRAAEVLEVSANARAQSAKAGNLMRECRYEEADAIVATALKDANPADRKFMMMTAGMLAEHRNDLPAAIRYYEEAAAGEQVALEALHMLGRARIANRQFAEGHKSLMGYVNTAIELKREFPSENDVAALAVAAAELGQLQDALKTVEVVIKDRQTYGALISDLKEAIVAAQNAPGGVEPGRFWKLAYGGEQPIGLPVDDFWPQPLERKPPQYPEHALKTWKEGYVVLRISLDEEGNVTKARVVESEPGNTFDSAARNAVLKWKFKPHVRNCKPVPGEGIQQINFRMRR